jgi:transcriptional regulator with XRE-family HTH domain
MNPPNHTQWAVIGATLAAMRDGAGLKQEELAERVEKHKSTISRIEKGTRVPSPELLAQITRVIADEINAKRAAA